MSHHAEQYHGLQKQTLSEIIRRGTVWEEGAFILQEMGDSQRNILPSFMPISPMALILTELFVASGDTEANGQLSSANWQGN